MAEETYAPLTRQEEALAEGLAQRYMAEARQQVIKARPELQEDEDQLWLHVEQYYEQSLAGLPEATQELLCDYSVQLGLRTLYDDAADKHVAEGWLEAYHEDRDGTLATLYRRIDPSAPTPDPDAGPTRGPLAGLPEGSGEWADVDDILREVFGDARSDGHLLGRWEPLVDAAWHDPPLVRDVWQRSCRCGLRILAGWDTAGAFGVIWAAADVPPGATDAPLPDFPVCPVAHAQAGPRRLQLN